jgi:hypothetical protein
MNTLFPGPIPRILDLDFRFEIDGIPQSAGKNKKLAGAGGL